MNNRNNSEQRVFDFLLKIGFPETEITEPDKNSKSENKEPDFLIKKDKLIIEVKNFHDPELISENINFENDLKKGEVVSYFLPDKNDTFSEHTKSCRHKFRKYNDYSSLLVEDFTDYGIRHPCIDFIIKGLTTIFIDRKTYTTDVKYRNREFRIDYNTEIGAVLMMFNYKKLLYHNLMCDGYRKLPWYLWSNNISNIEITQFAFFAPPNQETRVYSLEKTK